ncbi:MAG: hypothetical protein ACK53F_04445, partial [Betaproteobacteria bacterium]
HFYKPAAWANFAPAVLAVHWVRVPCLPNPSAQTSPARDGFEKSLQTTNPSKDGQTQTFSFENDRQ